MSRFSNLSVVVLFVGFSLGRCESDSEILRRTGVGTNPEQVAKHLSQYSKRQPNPDRLDRLIEQLSAEEFETRERAAKTLVALGPVTIPKLEEALSSTDVEKVMRARKCLETLEKWKPDPSLDPSVRWVVAKRPRNGIEALLEFLPFAARLETRDWIWFGLDEWVRETKAIPEPLLGTLGDRSVARRALAGCLVARYGDIAQRNRAARLLADPNPHVRLRTAQGLIAIGDARGVPVLIELLGNATVHLGWQAEELLRWVGSTHSPTQFLNGGSATERTRCKEAWQQWWKNKKGKLPTGFRKKGRPALVIFTTAGRKLQATGRVWIVGGDGTVRWEKKNLSFPSDARVLATGNIVTAERETPDQPGRVAARDSTGKILWEWKGLKSPMLCQPTEFNAVFVASFSSTCYELNSQGNERRRWTIPGFADRFDRSCVRKTPDRILYSNGASSDTVNAIREWDMLTKETRAVGSRYGTRYADTTMFQSLPDGHFLISGLGRGYAIEWGIGQHYWRCGIPGSNHATRLPNGRTLIGGGGRLCEVSLDNRVVWEHFFDEDCRRAWDCLSLVRIGTSLDLEKTSTRTPDLLPSSLDPSSAEQRTRAIDYLSRNGARIPEARQILTKFQQDENEAIRLAATKAIKSIDRDEFTVLLKKVRNEPNSKKQILLLERELSSYLCEDRVLTPFLTELRKHAAPAVRGMATNILGRYSHESNKVLPILLASLKDSDSQVRRRAVGGLELLGESASPAIPRLLAILEHDPDRVIRLYWIRALARIGVPNTAEINTVLHKVAKHDSSERVREATLKFLEARANKRQ